MADHSWSHSLAQQHWPPIEYQYCISIHHSDMPITSSCSGVRLDRIKPAWRQRKMTKMQCWWLIIPRGRCCSGMSRNFDEVLRDWDSALRTMDWITDSTLCLTWLINGAMESFSSALKYAFTIFYMQYCTLRSVICDPSMKFMDAQSQHTAAMKGAIIVVFPCICRPLEAAELCPKISLQFQEIDMLVNRVYAIASYVQRSTYFKLTCACDRVRCAWLASVHVTASPLRNFELYVTCLVGQYLHIQPGSYGANCPQGLGYIRFVHWSEEFSRFDESGWPLDLVQIST